MSENKFIKKLKGESTTKSVLEIKNQSVNTSFANMPHGTSNANRVYADHSGDAVGVLQGAENWKLNGSTLVYASSVNSDGNDYTGETDKTGGSVVLDGDGMAVSGAGLWVNATYTFTGDPTKTVAIFTAGTKWALKLCGRSLFSDNKTIDFTMLIKIGTSSVISKVFTVTTDSFNFCKDLVIDFAESAQSIIKVLGNQTLTLQLLCSDTSASATIYNGMTVLTSLQRRVDMDAIAGNNYSLDGLETELNNIHSELDGKLNLDGTNTMTGVLKMRASVSFECAIAPYWHGVGFYKLNDNDSVTLLASMEATEGFEPGTNNTYNIGTTTKKWKNLYLAGKAYMSTINNGYDIAVPVTNSADTLALKSQVDDAANSGEQLYTTGVWFAKMYSASVVPTGAEYDGKNYADFSQVDNDNNPIVVIYEGQSSSWVEIARITPPANHVAYLTITSKIWDIAEQTDQQGGEVLWSYNQKTFTPYPKIVSVEGLANTDLSNLTNTGSNIANWSSNVSNCITEIPQDIKLELNNGTLTLKAGSKVYVPNGVDTFDEVPIASDVTASGTGSATTDLIIFYNQTTNAIKWDSISNCYSGGSAPTGQTDMSWYDTTNNIIKYTNDSGSTWNSGLALPVAIVSMTNGVLTSIKQVFNGFGYIGSSVFALPNIKWLTADGRNADGTLKNKENTNTTVLTTYYPYSDDLCFFMTSLGIFTASKYVQSETEPTTQYTIWYKPSENILRTKSTGDWSVVNDRIVFARSQTSTTGIVSFNPIQAFHAVDYNEADFVVEFQRPTAANNYTWYRKYKSGWVEQGSGLPVADNAIKYVTLPVPMADQNYTVNATIVYGDGSSATIGVQTVRSTTQIGIGCRYNGTFNNGLGAIWEVKGFAA